MCFTGSNILGWDEHLHGKDIVNLLKELKKDAFVLLKKSEHLRNRSDSPQRMRKRMDA